MKNLQRSENSEQRKDYKRLLVWQKSRKLCSHVYEITKKFPRAENPGLTSQMRRCAVSIPSNIAEGYGRFSSKSFANFLRIALGSLYELENQLIISEDIGYLNFSIETKELLIEVRKMLIVFLNNMKK